MSVNNYKLEFLHNGKPLVTSPAFKILTQNGMSASDYDITLAENVGFDGAIAMNTRTLPRRIDLAGTYHARERQKYISYFKPGAKGKLTVTYNGITRFIEYFVNRVNFASTNIYKEKELFELGLLCPQPFFLDTDDFGRNIAAIQPVFAFPWVQPTKRGIITDYRFYGSNTPIENKGDMPVGITVEITAKAPVKNPRFTIVNTDQFVEAWIDMVRGDVFVINTNEREVGITLNGENISMRYNRASIPSMKLETGMNAVRYSAEIGIEDVKVILRYRPKYLGI